MRSGMVRCVDRSTVKSDSVPLQPSNRSLSPIVIFYTLVADASANLAYSLRMCCHDACRWIQGFFSKPDFRILTPGCPDPLAALFVSK